MTRDRETDALELGQRNLDRLEDLHQSTTPGPWELGDGGWGVYVTSPGMNVWAREQVASTADAEFMVEVHRLWPSLISELRAAREVIDALHAWETMDARCFCFGHTPEEGDNVSRALTAYERVVSP